MPSAFHLRPYRTEDEDAAIALWGHTWQVAYPDIGPVAEDGAQASEELRTVARQFLHPLRQRDVQPLAEIGDPPLRFLVAFFRRLKRFFERGELAA